VCVCMCVFFCIRLFWDCVNALPSFHPSIHSLGPHETKRLVKRGGEKYQR
jgi:hypothetical protein